MVMGPTHAMSGAAVGLALAEVIPGINATPAVALTFAAVCAGAALLPDIDSPGSTVSRSLGPLTYMLSKGLGAASTAVYEATKTRRDNHRFVPHRTLTHTGVFAVAVAGGITALTGWGGKWAVLAVLFFMLALAIRGVLHHWAKKNGWIIVTAAAAGLTALAAAHLPHTGQPWLGLAVGIGICTHDLGDAITKEGVNFCAPFVSIRGKRWYEFALPSALRITAGGTFEKVLLMPALVVLTVWLVIVTTPAGHDAWASITGMF